MEAEAVEVGAEARLAAGDAEVGGERQAEPAADGRALHRGDDGLLGPEDARRLLVQVLAALVARAGRRPIGEVGARAERLALRAEHHGAARGIAVERLERVGDLVDQGVVEVVVRRALDLDLADVAGDADADVLVGRGHGAPPGEWWRRCARPG